MNNNLIEESNKFDTTKFTIDDVDYYVPYKYMTNEQVINLANSSEKQSYTMRTINVDGVDYYVPYSWNDSEHYKNIIRKSIKN